MARDPILATAPLSFPWPGFDPFLFIAFHEDAYPEGNEQMGPVVSLTGRELGNDFVVKDGFRMYHGDVVPGFPQHPHRGFETVTLVRRGLIDHSDSLGATARFGAGDVQWLTAGKGIVHSEMFPLVHRDRANPVELFQIWLNLPAASKLVEPHFSMFWGETVPLQRLKDSAGRAVEVALIAGRLGEQAPHAPPPASWASRPDADVAIWTVKMDPGATWTLPAAGAGVERALYLFRGAGLTLASRRLPGFSLARLDHTAVELVNGPEPSEFLLLQGRPIGEPVAAHGPFVMNTDAEIHQAFADYQRTRFGGWSWKSDGPVHPRAEGRFARHPDGRVERPPKVL
jgi:quercetin 2,3-dioxygenase